MPPPSSTTDVIFIFIIFYSGPTNPVFFFQFCTYYIHTVLFWLIFKVSIQLFFLSWHLYIKILLPPTYYSVCVQVYVFMYVHTCVYIWKPEVNLRCHSPGAVLLGLGLALPVRPRCWAIKCVPLHLPFRPGFLSSGPYTWWESTSLSAAHPDPVRRPQACSWGLSCGCCSIMSQPPLPSTGCWLVFRICWSQY